MSEPRSVLSPLGRAATSRTNSAGTRRTLIDAVKPRAFTRCLKYRLLAILVAMWTKPMRWFGTAHGWFKHVSDGSRSNGLKLVILLLALPCFKASHFCFKVAYALNLHRIRFIAGEHASLPFKNEGLKLNNLVIERGRISDSDKRLREIESVLKCANTGGDLSGVHHVLRSNGDSM